VAARRREGKRGDGGGVRRQGTPLRGG